MSTNRQYWSSNIHSDLDSEIIVVHFFKGKQWLWHNSIQAYTSLFRHLSGYTSTMSEVFY